MYPLQVSMKLESSMKQMLFLLQCTKEEMKKHQELSKLIYILILFCLTGSCQEKKIKDETNTKIITSNSIVNTNNKNKNVQSEAIVTFSDSIEEELYNLYKGYDNDEFAKKLETYLSDPKTMNYSLDELKEKINIFDFKQDNIRFFSFIWDGGSGHIYRTLIHTGSPVKLCV